VLGTLPNARPNQAEAMVIAPDIRANGDECPDGAFEIRAGVLETTDERIDD